MEEKFDVKLFAGTDFRSLDIRCIFVGVTFLPFFVAGAVLSILVGVEVLPSEHSLGVMLLILFVALAALTVAILFFVWYGKAYKKAKFVFYNSVEVEAVPLDMIKDEFNSPPKGSVYGITYALVKRPLDLFVDWYRVRYAEDDEEFDIFHVVNKFNEILVNDIGVADMCRYGGYARYTASYPFRKESDVTTLLNMHKIKIKINIDKGIALYYKPQYAGVDGAENNNL